MEHRYRARVRWTGNLGGGTREYRGYSRSHRIGAEGKEEIRVTSGLVPGGAPEEYTPEELLLGALASCHMLWYLHLCADAGIVVTEYADAPEGWMVTDRNGGRFVRARLHPTVTIAAGDPELARSLHATAHAKCFIASSVNFPVEHSATIRSPTGARVDP